MFPSRVTPYFDLSDCPSIMNSLPVPANEKHTPQYEATTVVLRCGDGLSDERCQVCFEDERREVGVGGQG